MQTLLLFISISDGILALNSEGHHNQEPKHSPPRLEADLLSFKPILKIGPSVPTVGGSVWHQLDRSASVRSFLFFALLSTRLVTHLTFSSTKRMTEEQTYQSQPWHRWDISNGSREPSPLDFDCESSLSNESTNDI